MEPHRLKSVLLVLPLGELAESLAALVAGGGAAAAGGLQRGAGGRAASADGFGRRAERDRRGSLRAEILRVGAPVERLVAERDAIVARAAEKMHVGLLERGRGVRLGKI